MSDGLGRKDRKQVQERLRLRPALMHEIVREEGEEELERSFKALWWSGVAAGISIGFSLVASGVAAASLPDANWSHLIVSLGYSAGFLIVVLGRQQLFTENTITALLPVISERSLVRLLQMLRLWAIVLCANLVGAALFAFALAFGDVVAPHYEIAFRKLAEGYLASGGLTNFTSGILAGWLIAAMVWTLASARHSRFAVIVFFTWLIGLGHFTHIIAGSVNMFYLLCLDQAGMGEVVFRFMLPTLAGNVVGGSALFALITYAQVRDEVEG